MENRREGAQGTRVGGDVDVGGDFIGRDSISVSRDNNERLQALHAQFNRFEDNVNFKLTLLSRDVENLNEKLAQVMIALVVVVLVLGLIIVVSIVRRVG